MGIDRFGVNLAGFNDITAAFIGNAGIGTTPAITKLLDNGAGSLGVWAFALKRGDGGAGIFQMEHGYVEGSPIYPHLHWFNTAAITAANTVIWMLEYMWINLAGLKPASTVLESITFTAPVGDQAAGSLLTTNFSAIVGTGKTISSILIASIKRGVDTHTDAANCAILGFDVHANRTKLGTQQVVIQP